MRVLLWVIEGTWAGCVDAAAPALPADAEVTILHVAPSDVPEIAEGARAGLLGRSRPRREPGARMATVSRRRPTTCWPRRPSGSAARRRRSPSAVRRWPG